MPDEVVLTGIVCMNKRSRRLLRHVRRFPDKTSAQGIVFFEDADDAVAYFSQLKDRVRDPKEAVFMAATLSFTPPPEGTVD